MDKRLDPSPMAEQAEYSISSAPPSRDPRVPEDQQPMEGSADKLFGLLAFVSSLAFILLFLLILRLT